MKKTLLLAAIAVTGFASASSAQQMPAAPITTLQNDGLYYIYDAHGDDGSFTEYPGANEYRYAFRHDHEGAINGTHIKPGSVVAGRFTLTNNHVWKATTDDNGATWSFQNVGTQKWMATTCSTTADETQKGQFVIEGSDPASYTVRLNDTDLRWDGDYASINDNVYAFGYDYSDNFGMVYFPGNGHPIKFYQAVPENDGHKLATATITGTFSPDPQKRYYLKISDLDAYLQLQSGRDGNLASLASTRLTPLTITEGTDANAGKFAIQSASSGKYFASDALWNSIFNQDTPYYWNISMIDDNSFTIAMTDVATNFAGSQGQALDAAIWTDNWFGRIHTSGSAHIAWTLVEANETPLELAISAVGAYSIGTGLGQYNNEAGDFAQKLADAIAVSNNESATDAEIQAAIASIDPSTLRINPVPSGYYRIRNVSNNKLLSSNVVAYEWATNVTDGEGNVTGTEQHQSNRLEMVDSNYSDAVWFYDAANRRLAAFANGLCLGKFNREGDNSRSWATVLNSEADLVADVEFTACSEQGKYAIITNDGRHIYGNTTTRPEGHTTADAANNDANDAHWTLEPVTWLPMPYDVNVGYLTIYTPAPLYMTDNVSGIGTQRVKPYIGTINDSKFLKTEIIGNTIPANTPVLLEFLNPEGGNHVENGHIFVEVAGPAETAVANDATNDLIGGIYAIAKADGTNYYVVGKPENSDASFLPAADYVPGFAAHIELTPEAGVDAPASFLISDPEQSAISEIEGAGNNARQIIYDLQGRRVQRAAKGLYIINGVKTLVK